MLKEPIKKEARVHKQAANDEELVLINQQSLRELKAEEVFAFKIAACDNQVDRDSERFTEDTLKELAALFVGRPVISDHNWSAAKQTARIYAAEVQIDSDVQRLILRAYMLRNELTQPYIDAIEAGILREVSVGCSVKEAICSICGKAKNRERCGHVPGSEYDGQVCHVDLQGASDAYEVSFVAVPCQREAGTIKAYGGENGEPHRSAIEASILQEASAKLELETKRFYGGYQNDSAGNL